MEKYIKLFLNYLDYPFLSGPLKWLLLLQMLGFESVNGCIKADTALTGSLHLSKFNCNKLILNWKMNIFEAAECIYIVTYLPYLKKN